MFIWLIVWMGGWCRLVATVRAWWNVCQYTGIVQVWLHTWLHRWQVWDEYWRVCFKPVPERGHLSWRTRTLHLSLYERWAAFVRHVHSNNKLTFLLTYFYILVWRQFRQVGISVEEQKTWIESERFGCRELMTLSYFFS